MLGSVAITRIMLSARGEKLGHRCIPPNISSLSHDHHRHVVRVAGDLRCGEVDFSHHRSFENAADSDDVRREAVRGAQSGSC